MATVVDPPLIFASITTDRDRIEKKISQHFSHTTTSREAAASVKT
jgi:hypothetical protein